MRRKHYELKVWQEAMKLAKEIYGVTSKFPKSETYGLTSQMRRAAISVPSNIAEGAARSGDKEFLQFLSIARGSLSELDTQFRLATDFGYCERETLVNSNINDVFGLLNGLINSIKRRM